MGKPQRSKESMGVAGNLHSRVETPRQKAQLPHKQIIATNPQNILFYTPLGMIIRMTPSVPTQLTLL